MHLDFCDIDLIKQWLGPVCTIAAPAELGQEAKQLARMLATEQTDNSICLVFGILESEAIASLRQCYDTLLLICSEKNKPQEQYLLAFDRYLILPVSGRKELQSWLDSLLASKILALLPSIFA
jgi:hypothetical protein